jgi:spoIIIJ-associated protein
VSREYTASAPSVDEALALALAELGVSAEEAEYEIVEEAGKKLFGGTKNAVVRVFVESDKDDEAYGYEQESVAAPRIASDSDGAEIISKTEKQFVQYDSIIDDLTDEQVDSIADAGIENLKKLVAFLHDGDIEVEEFEGDEGEVILDVSGDDIGVLIGRHGRTIDALQVIVSAITTKQMGIHYPLSIDVEGYKYRRKQKVISIARHAAERAKRTGRPVALKSMTPYERRVVHIVLRELTGITTTSEGTGSYRHVVVLPAS